MTKLQVWINNRWEYVFCRNVRKRDPVVTGDRKKALGKDALEYFQAKFTEHSFRLEKGRS